MKIIEDNISITELDELQKMAERIFGNMVKAVVDVENRVIGLEAELHADIEAELLEKGSNQQNLWGINLYPTKYGSENFIEFDSMINIRPSQNNRSRSVDNPQLRKKIADLVYKLITKPSADELYKVILKSKTPRERAKIFDGLFHYARKVNPEAFQWPKPSKIQ